ncbi:MAG: arsenical-resistance protein, partial [Dysgonamonadaceae bacterium]|nr:arsenical-resistance protein [Dysgonamonadaceae bacterium]
MTAKKQIGFFEKYLTIWVALCIVGGIFIGSFAGETMQILSKMEIYNVN